MARRLTVAERLMRLNRRGFSDEEIARATGRGKSYIQKVRTGKKPGESLAPAAARLDKLTRERKAPTARPLPNVTSASPRRVQRVRGKEVLRAPGERVYVGKARKTGHFHAWQTLYARILRADARGERVRLTLNWRVGQWMGRRGGKPRDGQQYTLWDDGITAYGALEELERMGWDRDPEGALAALVGEYTTTSSTYLRVEGLDSYSLQIYTPRGGWDVDDESEWM